MTSSLPEKIGGIALIAGALLFAAYSSLFLIVLPIAVLVGIAGSIDAVFAKDGGLTAADAAAYVKALAPNLDTADQKLITSGILDAYQVYVDVFKPKVITATDPNLILVLTSFKTGILEGVALWRSFPVEAAVEAQRTVPR